MKRLIVFDLDGTLAQSKSPIDGPMSSLLHELLCIVNVAVISGGDWPQFQKQVIAKLPPGEYLAGLSLLPTCGTKFFRYSGQWTKIYSEYFTTSEKSQILSAFHEAIDEAGIKPEKIWGELIEDRGSQITYSALGQQAPLAEKIEWDPNHAKRKGIKDRLDVLLVGFSIRMGGATSIDVTKPGIDKAYGIKKLTSILGISQAQMLYIGDALFPGGNDYPVEQAGVASIAVRDPEDTRRVVQTIIACLGDSLVEPQEKSLPRDHS